jgi:hypothetical protein
MNENVPKFPLITGDDAHDPHSMAPANHEASKPPEPEIALGVFVDVLQRGL